MPVYRWSQVANNNGNSDPAINWMEGMPPGAINDSGRATNAELKKYFDDISGAIVTAGTATAYTVASYSAFDTLAHLNGQMIAFTPHVTNGATATLNVDGLGAKPVRSAPNTEIPAGTLIQGTPYVVTYNNADGAFYLHGFAGAAYLIPIGATLEYWLPTAPNSAFVFPFGQAISRTTYAALFAAMGTTFGIGDGSTTFNLPDLRGRVTACMDNMGGSDSGHLAGSSLNSVRTALGGAGGEGTHTLALSELPTGINSSGNNTITVATSGANVPATTGTIAQSSINAGGSQSVPIEVGGSWNSITSMTANNAINVTSNNTSGSAHNVVQPTILCNRIMRTI